MGAIHPRNNLKLLLKAQKTQLICRSCEIFLNVKENFEFGVQKVKLKIKFAPLHINSDKKIILDF